MVLMIGISYQISGDLSFMRFVGSRTKNESRIRDHSNIAIIFYPL